jgi:hypothetical protein
MCEMVTGMVNIRIDFKLRRSIHHGRLLKQKGYCLFDFNFMYVPVVTFFFLEKKKVTKENSRKNELLRSFFHPLRLPLCEFDFKV